jgi:hypothetical protein
MQSQLGRLKMRSANKKAPGSESSYSSPEVRQDKLAIYMGWADEFVLGLDSKVEGPALRPTIPNHVSRSRRHLVQPYVLPNINILSVECSTRAC